MASLLTDSEAVLRERAQRVGLPQAAIDRLIAQHITTLAKLAFAPGQPGEQPTDERLKALIQIGADEPSLGALAAIRHLVFEAQTIMINQTKTMTENKEDTVKEVPRAERRERIKQQALRLQGLALRGNLECSYASYDLCMKLQVDMWCRTWHPASSLLEPASSSSRSLRRNLTSKHPMWCRVTRLLTSPVMSTLR